jgi:hypothetical protein
MHVVFKELLFYCFTPSTANFQPVGPKFICYIFTTIITPLTGFNPPRLLRSHPSPDKSGQAEEGIY